MTWSRLNPGISWIWVYHGTATADHLVASCSVSDVEPLGAENFVGNSLYVYVYVCEAWRWLHVWNCFIDPYSLLLCLLIEACLLLCIECGTIYCPYCKHTLKSLLSVIWSRNFPLLWTVNFHELRCKILPLKPVVSWIHFILSQPVSFRSILVLFPVCTWAS